MKDVRLSFFSIFVTILVTRIVNADERCLTSDREPGVCAPVSSCNTLSSHQIGAVTSESQCKGDNEQPWVCCPASQLPVPGSSICGKTFVQFPSRIVGGSDTCIGEHPWMALLMYQKSNRKLTTGCGGTLISSKHVLTAAHCLIKNNNVPNIPKFARLGEWKRSMTPNCQVYAGIQKCAEKEVDAEVDKSISHPHYLSADKNRHHDIALLFLKLPVSFSNFVRPLCILDSMNDHEDRPATVIGYGKTESAQSSDTLLAVELDVMKISICKQQYRIQDRTVQDTQLCAYKRNADTCNGDSGSPLMRQSDTSPSFWYLVGITSFGPLECGKTDYPGVYTNVNDYISWIKKNIGE